MAQFDVALRRLVIALSAADAAPQDVVSMVLYTTAMADYRDRRKEIGAAYRAHFGTHFPAMTMIAVAQLVDPMAVIEVAAVAVVPDSRHETAG